MANRIKSIELQSKKTIIKFHYEGQQPGYNELEEEDRDTKMTRIRHSSFVKAFEAITPHLAISYGFETELDTTGVTFDMTFFSNAEWKDNPRFKNITLEKIIVTGKYADDGIQLVGSYLSPDGTESPLKSPVIRFESTGEYNYPLRSILSSQWETVELEAQEFLKGKTGATPSMQTSIEYPAPQAKEPKMTTARKTMAAVGVHVN